MKESFAARMRGIHLPAKAKPLIIVAAAFMVLVAVFIGTVRITYVSYEGNERYTDEEMTEFLFPDSLSSNPLIFLLRERMGKNPKIPFVDRYTVVMRGIQSLDVIVYEKDIIGYVDKMGCRMYFDRDGYVVESSSEIISDVPCVTGINMESIVLGEQLPAGKNDKMIFEVVLNISQFIRENSIQWNGQETRLVSIVDRIHLNTRGEATCHVGDISVFLGNKKHMEDKLLEMSSILPELYGRKGTLYLDSYDENIENPTYIFKE